MKIIGQENIEKFYKEKGITMPEQKYKGNCFFAFPNKNNPNQKEAFIIEQLTDKEIEITIEEKNTKITDKEQLKLNI